MRTASLFMNGKNQAVRLPKEFEFEGVSEVEITKQGDSLVISPKRKSWASFTSVDHVDEDFLAERSDVLDVGLIEF